ncbi:hypothetical protein GOP47_0018908 [Adiantum capillus-veneris]|uniref:Pentapeptide repeat-containing protein n=1 Tax=Adiantum capillus-veneris TaxID=13818 RepID=A0A9D4UFC0_ADICA|nr:hypothetical protein GOP47_0018908 [Adiantum capillus-veneris]
MVEDTRAALEVEIQIYLCRPSSLLPGFQEERATLHWKRTFLQVYCVFSRFVTDESDDICDAVFDEMASPCYLSSTSDQHVTDSFFLMAPRDSYFVKIQHALDKCLRLQLRTTAALAVAVLGSTYQAEADLNKFEADMRGEFGIGSAAQFGSADLRKTVHTNENFRRANFTSTDMRETDFSGSTFNGAYIMEKVVAYKTNFENADLNDTLMDRMVTSSGPG